MIIATLKKAPPILVCGKCLRRCPDGRLIKKALKGEARRAAKGRKPPKIVQTKCLGLCPKHAVTIASAETLSQGKMLILREAAEAAEAVALLRERGTSRDKMEGH